MGSHRQIRRQRAELSVTDDCRGLGRDKSHFSPNVEASRNVIGSLRVLARNPNSNRIFVLPMEPPVEATRRGENREKEEP
jgi:hypothetical protein